MRLRWTTKRKRVALAVIVLAAIVTVEVGGSEYFVLKLFGLFVRTFPANVVVLLGFFLYLRDRHKH